MSPRNCGIGIAYTAYFNKRYKKVGHLWQGRFKSKVIVKDQYLIDCIQYIEYNPVRAQLAKAAEEYLWSSYRERILSVESKNGLLDRLRLWPKGALSRLSRGRFLDWDRKCLSLAEFADPVLCASTYN